MGRIGLGEGLEDAFALGRGDSGAGVGDGETQAAIAGGLRQNQDAAGFGELHGVAGQVQQDLLEPHLVGLDR